MSYARKRRRYRVEPSSTDRAFDELVPAGLRHLSGAHWTPVGVAARAVALLDPSRNTRVLDVGGGVGKLCVVGAMATGTWCAIEQHEELVYAARRLSHVLGVEDKTAYLHGDAFDVDWHEFDAFYFYNPFELALSAVDGARYQIAAHARIALVEERLASLRAGVRVITYHGFGGVMPRSYELVYHEKVSVAGLDLALWVQHAANRDRSA